MPVLVLASTSPFRRQILEGAGLLVRAVAPGVDEVLDVDGGPEVNARRLALAKARAVAVHTGGWVLGADQVVWDGREVFGKPSDPADHLERLRALRGRHHDLVTGWALLGPGVEAVGLERTRLWVRAELTDAELAAYVATGEGSGCAGGYAAEGHGAWLFERIEGDWFNVLGLPLFAVLGALRRHGWRYGEHHA